LGNWDEPVLRVPLPVLCLKMPYQFQTAAEQKEECGECGAPGLPYGSDARQALRIPMHIPVSLSTQRGEILAATENISATGIALLVDAPLELNTPIQCSLRLQDLTTGPLRETTIHYAGRVVRCSPHEGKWRVAIVLDEYYFAQ
jgi:hypothetical protein